MAKGFGGKFLDAFSISKLEEDEFDDDLFDDDDDFDYDQGLFSRKKKQKQPKQKRTDFDDDYDESPRTTSRAERTPARSNAGYEQPAYNAQKQQPTRQAYSTNNNASNKVVDINSNQRQQGGNKAISHVYVIKPQEMSDAEIVAKQLLIGKTILVNMEGVELSLAQRIIDFIGGASYAIGGTLSAASGSMFIAAPSSIGVTGDLREEILNDVTLSPDLTKY